MPIVSVIDQDNGIVVSTESGEITFEELRDEAVRLGQDPLFDPNYKHLLNGLNGDCRNLRPDDLAALSTLSPFAENAQRAMVMPTELGYGLARVYKSYLGKAGENVRIFRSMDEALVWLGLPADFGGAG